MRIVVIGGNGRIGRGLAERLQAAGHEVVAASRSTGVDSETGAGLDAALAGASVVVDVSRPASLDEDGAMRFFEASSRNLVAAGLRAGVGHHLVLSIVGADRLPRLGWMRAKTAQERIVAAGGIPSTIVRSTQFFEFLPALADEATHDGVVRLSPVLLQPVAVADVAEALAGLATSAPLGGVVELAGPRPLRLADAARRVLAADGDPRTVVADASVGYLGGAVTDTSLTPGHDPGVSRQLRGRLEFDAWLAERRSTR